MFVAANLSRVPVASRSPTQLRRQKHACVASRTVAHGCMRTTLPTQTAKSTQRIAQHSQGPERSRSRAVYMITSAAAAGSAQDAAKVCGSVPHVCPCLSNSRAASYAGPAVPLRRIRAHRRQFDPNGTVLAQRMEAGQHQVIRRSLTTSPHR